MSRFDDLCAAFAVWHQDAMFVRHAWTWFPFILAKHLRNYLGAPESFEDPKNAGRLLQYVSVGTVVHNDETDAFDLKFNEGQVPFSNLELTQADGLFYFALVVHLEEKREASSRQPFWFLFSLGMEDQDHSALILHRTDQEFIISHRDPENDDVLNPICASITQLLMKDISISPFARRDQQTIAPASRERLL